MLERGIVRRVLLARYKGASQDRRLEVGIREPVIRCPGRRLLHGKRVPGIIACSKPYPAPLRGVQYANRRYSKPPDVPSIVGWGN